LGRTIEKNPLRGLKVPREENPRRPRISVEQFKALQLVGAEVSPAAELFVWVAWYTGHRAGAIRQLRWTDVDLDARTIRWRAEADKVGFEHRTPMHSDLVDLLEREQQRAGAGAALLFPSPFVSSKPMSREDATDLWSTIANRAEIPQGERYGWHSFRRSFANQLRDVPLKELQTLGGWKSEQTVVRVYLQPDEDAQRRALERLGLSRERGHNAYTVPAKRNAHRP
jgi:integrase